MIACVLLPSLAVTDTGDDRHVGERIVTHLQAVSDRIELDRTPNNLAVLLVELGTLKSSDALRLSQYIIQIIQTQCPQSVYIGIAPDKFTSLVAASTGEPDAVSQVENPAHFLAPVSTAYLPASGEILRRLTLFGIHTLGQFAALPTAAVFEQFGREGLRLQRLAQGQDERPVVPYRLQATLARSQQFDAPVDNRLILDAVLQDLSQKLNTLLQATNQTTCGLVVTLELERGHRLEQFRIVRDEPMNRAVQTAFQHLLPQVDCGVWGVGVELTDLVPVLPRQLELFPMISTEVHRFEQTRAELVGRYPEGGFYTPVVIDSTEYLLERRCRLDRAG